MLDSDYYIAIIETDNSMRTYSIHKSLIKNAYEMFWKHFILQLK